MSSLIIVYLCNLLGMWPSFGRNSYNLRYQNELKGCLVPDSIYKKWEKLDVVMTTPAIYDIDNDSIAEVIVGTCDGSNAHLYAFNGEDGSLVWSYQTLYWIYSSPAIADIDRDDELEVIVGSHDGGVHVLTAVNGVLEWKYQTNGTIISSPAIADINNDNTLEVVIGSCDSMVYAISGENGSLVWSYPTGNEIWSSPAIADIDNDNYLEIVITAYDTTTYAINGEDGSLLWSYPVGNCGSPFFLEFHSPTIADIDNDNNLEVVIGSCDSTVYAINGENGSLLWSIYHSESGDPSGLSIGDVDGDGWLEIATGGCGPITIIDANCGPLGIEENDRKVNSVIITPNPFFKSVTFKYYIWTPTDVSIRIYDLMGNLIDIVTDKKYFCGIHTSRWEPKNISQGIYFVKFESEKFKATYKLLYIKHLSYK